MAMNKLKAATEKIGDAVSSAVARNKKTKDQNFNEVIKLFEEQQSNLKHLGQDIINFIAGVDAMLAAQKSMAENLLKVLPQNSPVANTCTTVLQSSETMMLAKKQLLDTSLNNGFIIPLNTYQGQYREIAERVKERSRREGEMFKTIDQRDKYQKHNDARYNAAEQRVVANTQAFEDLNREIIEDIPKLIADSENFFQPLIYQVILNQATFWSTMTQHAQQLASTVDQSQAYTPTINQVITPKQTSSMTRKYASVAVNPWANDLSRPALGAPPGNPWGNPAIEAPPDSGHTPGLPPGGPYGGAPANPNPYGGAHGGPGHGGPPHGGAHAPYGGAPPGGAPGGGAPLPPRPVRNTPAPPPSVQARGMWDFQASDPSELSFKSGDILTIIEQKGDWWIAEFHGTRGQIPGNYVQLIQ